MNILSAIGKLFKRTIPAVSPPELTSEYAIGGGWGASIHWLNPEKDFQGWNGEINRRFRVYGHHPRIPSNGQTLLGKFNTMTIQFEFVSVKRCGDPPDMFFADVKPVAYCLTNNE